MTVKEYDDVMDAAYFMRAQAGAMIEEADCIECEMKTAAVAYVGDQDLYCGPLMPLRHRLWCKENGIDIGPNSGPLPATKGKQ